MKKIALFGIVSIATISVTMAMIVGKVHSKKTGNNYSSTSNSIYLATLIYSTPYVSLIQPI